MFPNALFVHIVRDPYVVFSVHRQPVEDAFRTHGLQRPTFQGLEEQVFATFTRMYEALERGRKLVDPKRFYELAYEDLIRDPVAEMAKLYEHLNLGGFAEYLPRLEQYLSTIKGYETNKYRLTAEQRAEIGHRWKTVIERYGYQASGAA